MLFIEFIGGFIGLFLGGRMIVRYVVDLAYKFRISPLFISMIVIGFVTSVPELLTCVDAALLGAHGIAIGNIIGSNISNIFLIIGIAVFIAPISYNRPKIFKRDGSVLLFSVFLTLFLVMEGEVGRGAGIFLLLFLVVYTVFSMFQERKQFHMHNIAGEEESFAVSRSTGSLIMLSFIGMIITLIGADFLVSGAVKIARWGGVSESIIGLTLVALGTSLPELATSMVAVQQGHGEVAFGNVIGSNLYNIFGILGLTSIVVPLEVPEDFGILPLWIMVVATLIFLIFTYTGRRISRLEGAFLLLCYVLYLYVIF